MIWVLFCPKLATRPDQPDFRFPQLRPHSSLEDPVESRAKIRLGMGIGQTLRFSQKSPIALRREVLFFNLKLKAILCLRKFEMAREVLAKQEWRNTTKTDPLQSVFPFALPFSVPYFRAYMWDISCSIPLTDEPLGEPGGRGYCGEESHASKLGKAGCVWHWERWNVHPLFLSLPARSKKTD